MQGQFYYFSARYFLEISKKGKLTAESAVTQIIDDSLISKSKIIAIIRGSFLFAVTISPVIAFYL